MNRKMFSKLSNFLQNAVDTFAPNLTPLEEFVYHWKCVTNFFVDNKDGRQRIEETAIGGHIERMLEILQQEEIGSGEIGTTGPCLEYLLQHRLLDTLYTLGRTDQPPGMKQVVLSFFTRLLSRLKHPLLPHINVHRAVQRLVKACGEVKAAPTEKEEIEFLCTVCAKIKTDPYLVNFFLESPPKQRREEKKGEASAAGTVVSPPKAANVTSLRFGLVDALVSLAQSEDAWVAVKACEGLMLCGSLPEPTAAACIVERTQFCSFLAGRLVTQYDALPTAITPALIDSVDAKWGFDTIGEREEDQGFPGRRRVVALVSWLDYVDRVAEAANPTVATAVSREVSQQLFSTRFQASLLQAAESTIIVYTAYLTRCLRTVCSSALLKEFCFFILGTERTPEPVNQSEPKLRYRFLERCNHLSEEVCLVTLRLFDILLQKEEEHIFHNLVLRNLLGRDYYQPPSSGSGDQKDTQKSDPNPSNANENEEEKTPVNEEEKNSTEGTDATQSPTSSCPDSPAVSIGSTGEFPGNLSSPARPEVHKVVNSFLSLLPEEAKSSYQTADSSYDMYLRDAHKQYASLEEMCKGWGWPSKAHAVAEFHQEEFYMGSFLKLLFCKLEGTLVQSHAVNLLVTGLVARLAQIPHPALHEFLLDPFLSIKPGVHALFTTLTKMSGEIRSYMKSEPEFSRKLTLARKQLLGITYNLQNLRQTPKPIDPEYQWFEDQGRMEAVIVLEEFCKELSAIAFVKHHAAVTKS
ncbi:FHF complex subunit HOOK interacting protein 2A-like isoform X2 [Littorina saxatilis]|uniref:FHF complex subunit HOOK-interacting protein C-terminal domain-containing protein n=1 Tax=Littorina saxatilis TaxID=31220 RepID=A0AAN9BQN7_9CAEN